MKSVYNAHIVNRGGETPYIDPLTGAARFTAETLRRIVDNPHEPEREGINSLVISSFPLSYHIDSVSGWTPHSGIFCIMCGQNEGRDTK